MSDKKFDSGAGAKLRFPDKVFYWYDKRIGPFDTAVECATEYAKAFKTGESYSPPTSITSAKAVYDRPVGQVPSLHLSAKQGKCQNCVDSQYPCPACYTVWWNRKYPESKVDNEEYIRKCCVCGTTSGLHKDGEYGYRCDSDDCICI